LLAFSLARGSTSSLSVLVVGAHSDDIEIGCGGTLLQLARDVHDLSVYWVVLGARGERADEARRSADALLSAVPGRTVVIQEFRDAFLPYVGESVKEFFEDLKQKVSPDVIFTHQRHDLHQDHRLVCELTWNTFRDHLIVEYEVPKYDGDVGTPNFFVHLDDEIVRRKVDLLLDQFATQRDRRWFTDDLFRALMRIRGMESNAPSGYAEGFYARKLVWSP
jgi:LmbE family N-acetylglucosaminyl deacetylase